MRNKDTRYVRSAHDVTGDLRSCVHMADEKNAKIREKRESSEEERTRGKGSNGRTMQKKGST